MRMYHVRHLEIEPMRLTAEIHADIAKWSLRQALKHCAWWKKRAEGYAQFIIRRAAAARGERRSVNKYQDEI